jgi:hypothetical protein
MSCCGVACGHSQFSSRAQGVDSVLAVKRPVIGGACRRNPQHFGVCTQVRGFSAQVIHRFVHRKASKQVSCRARRQQWFGVLVLAGHAACRNARIWAQPAALPAVIPLGMATACAFQACRACAACLELSHDTRATATSGRCAAPSRGGCLPSAIVLAGARSHAGGQHEQGNNSAWPH